MKKFKEFKIDTHHPDLSNAIQRKAFDLGYRWCGNSSDQNNMARFLFFNYQGGISYEFNDQEFFNSHEFKELSIPDLFKLTPEDVVVEPERFCVALEHNPCLGQKETFQRHCTQDQIDRIKAIMDEHNG